MDRKPAKRSSLFLLELMIAILFFALSSAVCVQLFTNARVKSQNTEALNHALSEAQNTAELFSASDSFFEDMKEFYRDSELHDNTLTVFFDSYWDVCSSQFSQYKLTAEVSDNDSLQTCSISVNSVADDRRLYSLKTLRHVPLSP